MLSLRPEIKLELLWCDSRFSELEVIVVLNDLKDKTPTIP